MTKTPSREAWDEVCEQVHGAEQQAWVITDLAECLADAAGLLEVQHRLYEEACIRYDEAASEFAEVVAVLWPSVNLDVLQIDLAHSGIHSCGLCTDDAITLGQDVAEAAEREVGTLQATSEQLQEIEEKLNE